MRSNMSAQRASLFARSSALRVDILARGVTTKPAVKPLCPNFSSGPCKKRPGYALESLASAPLGRSHRAKIGKDKLARSIQLTRELLEPVGLPKDYHIGIVPGL